MGGLYTSGGRVHFGGGRGGLNFGQVYTCLASLFGIENCQESTCLAGGGHFIGDTLILSKKSQFCCIYVFGLLTLFTCKSNNLKSNDDYNYST